MDQYSLYDHMRYQCTHEARMDEMLKKAGVEKYHAGLMVVEWVLDYFKEYNWEFKREYDEYIRSLRDINQEIEEIINHFLSDTAILDYGKDLEVDLTNWYITK